MHVSPTSCKVLETGSQVILYQVFCEGILQLTGIEVLYVIKRGLEGMLFMSENRNTMLLLTHRPHPITTNHYQLHINTYTCTPFTHTHLQHLQIIKSQLTSLFAVMIYICVNMCVL